MTPADWEDLRMRLLEEQVVSLTNEVERLLLENEARQDRNVQLDQIRRELWDACEQLRAQVAKMEIDIASYQDENDELKARLAEIDKQAYTPDFMRAIAGSTSSQRDRSASGESNDESTQAAEGPRPDPLAGPT